MTKLHFLTVLCAACSTKYVSTGPKPVESKELGSLIEPKANAAREPKRETIVDELIRERAPALSSKPWLWAIMRKLLDPLLRYEDAVHLSKVVAQQPGRETFKMCSEMLDLVVDVSNLERIPSSGRCTIVCNHPTGLADGIAIHDLLIQVRDDFMIYANSDAKRVSKTLLDILIPIDLDPEDKRHSTARDALIATRQVYDNEQALVIFPSGRLSYMTWRGLRERDWKPSFIRMAQKNNTPIIPIHMKTRNSWLFYVFALLSTELRDISLFYELLNKSGKHVDCHVGPAIDPNGFKGQDNMALCQKLKDYVESGQFERPFEA